MEKQRKMTGIEKVLINRDEMTPQEAYDYLQELREMVRNGEDPEQLLYDELGLEPDYIFDLI
jgi:hypothetical protein